jgi:hypothetical protein
MAMQSGYIADRAWGSRLFSRRPWANAPGPLPKGASSAPCGLAPLTTNAPAHRGTWCFWNHPPRPGLRRTQRTTLRSLEPGAPFTAGISLFAAGLRQRSTFEPPRPSEDLARSLPTWFSRACAARQMRFGLADLTHLMPPNGCCQSSELRAHREHPQPRHSHWPAATTGRPARGQAGRYKPPEGLRARMDTRPPRRRPLAGADLPPKRPGSDTPCRWWMPDSAGRSEPGGGAEAAS